MAGVSVWNPLQIILMFRLSLPELPRGHDFRNNLARPQFRSVDVGDCLLGYLSLFVGRVKNGRAIAGPDIVSLPV